MLLQDQGPRVVLTTHVSLNSQEIIFPGRPLIGPRFTSDIIQLVIKKTSMWTILHTNKVSLTDTFKRSSATKSIIILSQKHRAVFQ
jgi:hypothetical protein